MVLVNVLWFCCFPTFFVIFRHFSSFSAVASAKAAVKDYESRPHKQSTTLRSMGVMEYKIEQDEAYVAASADLNEEDYEVPNRNSAHNVK